MAENLTKAGITAFLAPFSAAYAYMPRVNKIFLGNKLYHNIKLKIIKIYNRY